MMKTIYHYRKFRIRTAGSVTEPWFVARDCAMALALTNPAVAARKLLQPEQVEVRPLLGANDRRKMICLSVAGVRRLIEACPRPSPRNEFRQWFDTEVLPDMETGGAGEQTETPAPEEGNPRASEWTETSLRELESTEWELQLHALEGTAVAVRAADGYVNATALCLAAGKRFADFYLLESTEATFDELSAAMGIPTSDLCLIREGARPLEQGIWIHPLAVHYLAWWCSPAVYVDVSIWLEEWRTRKLAPAASLLTPEFLEKWAAAKRKTAELKRETLDLKRKTADLSQEIAFTLEVLYVLNLWEAPCAQPAGSSCGRSRDGGAAAG